MRSASPTPLANAGHSKAFKVTCSSSAIDKCVRLGYKPWKRLPGVVPKRNVLRSSSMAYPPSIAEIPATTPPRPVAANPPESPPLSRTASARRCGGPSTRRQSMAAPMTSQFLARPLAALRPTAESAADVIAPPTTS
jgi:hypothetical protein